MFKSCHGRPNVKDSTKPLKASESVIFRLGEKCRYICRPPEVRLSCKSAKSIPPLHFLPMSSYRMSLSILVYIFHVIIAGVSCSFGRTMKYKRIQEGLQSNLWDFHGSAPVSSPQFERSLDHTVALITRRKKTQKTIFVWSGSVLDETRIATDTDQIQLPRHWIH